MLPKAPTAASGVRKLGISAALKMLRAAFTVVSPIQQDKSGLPIAFSVPEGRWWWAWTSLGRSLSAAPKPI